MAIPTELSGRLKRDPRSIVARFRELAPAHAPVSIRTWDVQRVVLTAGAVLGSLALAAMAIASLFAGVR
ncbi:hypothetical protein BH18ACT17_BH18ACT17_12120 [soil metagenome]